MSQENFIDIIRYENRFKNQWDNFVDEAKNSTFLFKRDFMEYHSDRFDDFSLLFFLDDELVALLPACKIDTVCYSHKGLTYGGLILNERIGKNDYFKLYDSLKIFLKHNNFSCFVLKQQHNAFNKDIFAWTNQYFDTILKKELNLTADLFNLNISKSKLKHYKRNEKNAFEIKIENDFSAFWIDVLQPLLWNKYSTKPVHSLKEIQSLKNKFPENIHQYSLYYNDRIIAGITIFVSNNVVKSQYGAATDLGKKLRAMDYLFIKLLYHYKDLKYHYFDMGTVTDSNSKDNINIGMLQQKKELGCDVFNQFTFNFKII